MAQGELNTRLTTMDASFLNFEKKEAPLHIGGIYVFDGEVSFDKFMQLMDAKLPTLPRYFQKVVPAPFNVGHPSWEVDPNFSLKNHIFQLQIASPGTLDELNQLAAKLLATMLDRNKPLWEIYLISGLEGGNSAMVTKVHHAMVDGISGVDLMNLIFDITPNETIPAKVISTSAPAKRSSANDFTQRYIDGLLSSAEERMKSWTEFQKSLLNLTQAWLKTPAGSPPPSLSRAIPTTPVSLLPFNQPNTGEIKLAWSEFSFAEARAIRAALGGTVNDVVLTILSGAVSRYLELHQFPTSGRTLRLMVPVSMRKEDQRGALGNLVSVLPVELPLDLKNPLERYAYVNKKMNTLKEGRVAEGVNLFTALMGTVPPWMQTLFGTLSTLGDSPVPVYNMVCTNVPGPQVPLYALGKRMTKSYPFVPVAATVGTSCAILSYDQRLFFGITADSAAMPDLARLKAALEASFAELREAAGVPPISLTKVETVLEAQKSTKTRARKPKAAQPAEQVG